MIAKKEDLRRLIWSTSSSDAEREKLELGSEDVRDVLFKAREHFYGGHKFTSLF